MVTRGDGALDGIPRDRHGYGRYALVPHDVALTDSAGDRFTLRGALRDAQNLNSAGGTGDGSFTAHFEVIARHAGVVDNVALVGHMDQDGNGRFEDSGTCEMPATRPGG